MRGRNRRTQLRITANSFGFSRAALASSGTGRDPADRPNDSWSFPPGGQRLISASSSGNCFGVGPASSITALSALGLRQQRVDIVGNRIAFDGSGSLNNQQQQTPAASSEMTNTAISMTLTGPQLGTSPEKPPDAIDIRPAVISAMARPRNGTGTSGNVDPFGVPRQTHQHHREAARPAVRTVPTRRIYGDSLHVQQRHATAQLVVISGRKMPSTCRTAADWSCASPFAWLHHTAITSMKAMVQVFQPQRSQQYYSSPGSADGREQ